MGLRGRGRMTESVSQERVDLARYIPLLEKMKANAEARNKKEAKQ